MTEANRTARQTTRDLLTVCLRNMYAVRQPSQADLHVLDALKLAAVRVDLAQMERHPCPPSGGETSMIQPAKFVQLLSSDGALLALDADGIVWHYLPSDPNASPPPRNPARQAAWVALTSKRGYTRAEQGLPDSPTEPLNPSENSGNA